MIIYKITNKINKKIYVGLTTCGLGVRWNQHVQGAISGKENRLISKAIRKYGKESFLIEQIDSAFSLEELNKKEIKWIVNLNSHYLNGHGYNMAFGGNSRSGWKENPLKTKIRTSKNKKPILCVTTGKIFDSIKDAAEALSVSPGFIRNVCAGIKISAKGLNFQYLLDENKNKKAKMLRANKEKYIKEHNTFGRTVVCITDGRKFKSVKQAAKEIGIAEINLRKHLRKKTGVCKGSIFKYEDQLKKESL